MADSQSLQVTNLVHRQPFYLRGAGTGSAVDPSQSTAQTTQAIVTMLQEATIAQLHAAMLQGNLTCGALVQVSAAPQRRRLMGRSIC